MKVCAENIEQSSMPEPNSGCWLWMKKSSRRGYGVFIISQYKQILAHRASWMAYRGVIPDGIFVCHKCDNPCCVNPYHLFLGTALDNAQDMLRKGRGNKASGERNGKAKLSSAQVAAIRSDPRSSPPVARESNGRNLCGGQFCFPVALTRAHPQKTS